MIIKGTWSSRWSSSNSKPWEKWTLS